VVYPEATFEEMKCKELYFASNETMAYCGCSSNFVDVVALFKGSPQ
jgi:hypothetical protein